ncbi:MAG TPA: T9SS type A sorting domain-containing protein [Chitinophagales bacterium]|nr:T9SS type A sorting domain-containing protein [Chitinophagales bacterium]
MKKVTLIIFLFVCWFHFTSAQPKLYIYIVSHNEDNIGYLNGASGHLNYLSARNALINVCNMVQQKNLAYDYGADHVALRAIAQYDTGAVIANTNNKNLVKWMAEDRGVECDPHSHESTYNYADVAYLMSQLGVTPSNTMSGFLYNQLQNGNNWEDYQSGVTGDSFPSFTWHPEILWGAATPNHLSDPQYFGMYKPKSMAEFTVHEPSNHLILCGTGCALKLNDTATVAYKFSQIKNVIDAIQNGTVPSDGIYTQEIFFSEGDADAPWFYPLLNQLADSIATLVAEGKAEWKTIADIVDYWKTDFGEQPFAMDCGFNVLLQPNAVSEIKSKEALTLFPNPANDVVYINFQLKKSSAVSMKLYNVFGSEIKILEGDNEEAGNHQMILNIQDLFPGSYYCVMKTEKENSVIKLIVEK